MSPPAEPPRPRCRPRPASRTPPRGHSKVVPLTHGGMSRTTRRSSRPAVSSSRSPAARPIPTGSSANRRAIAEEPLECARRPHCVRHAGDVMTAIREQDHGGSLGIVGEMRGALFHRFDVVGVDADGVLEVGAQALCDRPRRRSAGSQRTSRLPPGRSATAGPCNPRHSFAFDANWTSETVVSPGHEIGGQRVDPVGHPFERTREARSVPGVVEDGRREVEAEDDVGAVGRLSRRPKPIARRRTREAGRRWRWRWRWCEMPDEALSCRPRARNNLVAGARNRDGSQVGPPAHASRVLRCWIVVSSGRSTTQPVALPRVNEMDCAVQPNDVVSASWLRWPPASGASLRRSLAASSWPPAHRPYPDSVLGEPGTQRLSGLGIDRVSAAPSSPGSPAAVAPTDPPACTEATFAYDPASEAMLLLNCVDQTDPASVEQVWSWDGSVMESGRRQRSAGDGRDRCRLRPAATHRGPLRGPADGQQRLLDGDLGMERRGLGQQGRGLRPPPATTCSWSTKPRAGAACCSAAATMPAH